ncbi:uncharacterized protein J3D65DRAFT_675117 [Phyllosticta citribraziliensis]|uniref:Uncharacterized protein n=1 Tax=Phyllosticta citribraziliensis TaxID=989973 RepID=A0ABR1M1X3_9PEZI
MYTKALISVALVALAASVSAAPAPAADVVVPGDYITEDAAPALPLNTTDAVSGEEQHTHDKRTPPIKLYFCDKQNWKGRCIEKQFTPGYCYNLGNAWNDQMASVGPELYGACTLYDTNYCRGKSVSIFNPGTPNLGAYGMGRRVTSLKCFPWSP